MKFEKVFEEIRSKKPVLARALTFVESEADGFEQFLDYLFPHTGGALRIGITGPPGAGKSTITNQLTKYFRVQGHRVGIIAVDPSSPFSGGALLGDRVRMTEIGKDEGVFIRSMATRGSLGGLARKARDLADILDAAGYERIIFETVGVGQSELDIVEAADAIIVILVPESGDSIQAMKAGLMEIADIFIMNKSDRPGADQAISALNTILMMQPHDENSWLRPVVKTVATENSGIAEIGEKIESYIRHLHKNEAFFSARLQKAGRRIKEVVEEKLIQELWETYPLGNLLLSRRICELMPYNSAQQILTKYKTK